MEMQVMGVKDLYPRELRPVFGACLLLLNGVSL